MNSGEILLYVYYNLKLIYSLFVVVKVPEETRNILVEYGYPCECRGKIYVKGKGDMVTYVVRPKNEIF